MVVSVVSCRLNLFAVGLVAMSQRITILGAGIIGLTSGIRLLEEGARVHLVSDVGPLQSTSQRAAAIWYPYLAMPRDRVQQWGRVAYDRLIGEAERGVPGVRIVPMLEFFEWSVSRPWWAEDLASFRFLRSDELQAGYVDGFHVMAPIMTSSTYLTYLLDRFMALGGTYQWVTERYADLLSFVADYPGDGWINATGLGAREVASDPALFGVQGQVVRVTHPGFAEALLEDEGRLGILYIVPRETDCIVGGTAVKGVEHEGVDAAVTQDILRRAATLEPRMAACDVIDAHVGIRPGRPSVRLERDADIRGLVHNYGHGGAGFTLSWGCADEVTSILTGGSTYGVSQ